MTKQWRSALFCAVVLAGCGSDGGGTGEETSANTGAVNGQNGDSNTGGGANGQSGGNTTAGGGSAGNNTGSSAGNTAGNSAGSDDDAGASTGDMNPPSDDPGAAAGVVSCGDTACTTPDICCVSFLGGANGGLECKPESECGGGFSAPGTCDGKEDCGADEACCAKFALTGGSGAFCEAGCTGDAKALCHADSDCGSGETCIPCAPPTMGIVDLVYHLCSATTQCPSPYMNVP